MNSQFFKTYREKVRKLAGEIKVLAVAYRDRRVPWYAKLMMGLVIAYALSPVDLIPDFIPVLGLLDDLLLVPCGVYLCLKMLSPEVIADSREKAAAMELKKSYAGAVIIGLIWLLLAFFLGRLVFNLFNKAR